ncbi:hypothetical protein, partial [Viscerimonas tarda]
WCTTLFFCINQNKTGNKHMDKEQLTQAIIDEMNAQGFLDGFRAEKTGEALLEIQYADETLVCKVDAGKPDEE